MYLSLIHQIISIILFTNLYQLVHSNHSDIPSNLISKNTNDRHLSTITTVKDNQMQNGSFNIIVRMIAFGIQHTDDNKQQKLVDVDLPGASNKKSRLPTNKAPDRSKNEQTEEFQQNTQLLLLPLMIRMLFERISERADATEQSKDLQKTDEIIYKSNTNKQNIFYESVKRFIITTADVNKIEKATMIVFLILSFAVFLFTTFSIIHRLRDTRKFHIIRVDSSSVNTKNNHEETKKLLP